MMTVNSISEGDHSSAVTQLVVDASDDYAVFAVLGETGLSKENYFIEYSGLFWHGCGEKGPTASERDGLAGMWPLAVGKSTQVVVPDIAGDLRGVRIEIKDLVSRQSEVYGDKNIAIVQSYQPLVETSEYAVELGANVRIDWGVPGSDNYDGYDEVVSISEDYANRYADVVAFGKANCTPS
jgi:hypothetical protein